MSIHPSLRRSKNSKAGARNVMKRHERVRHMLTQGTWKESQPIFGLPKIKQIRAKARKAAPKEAKAAEGAAGEAAAPAAEAKPAPKK